MWPFLRNEDVVAVHFFPQPKAMAEFPVGKILLCREGEEWVAHRLVTHQGRKVLKGDFSNSYFWERDAVVWGEANGFQRGPKRVGWEGRDFFLQHLFATLSARTLRAGPVGRKILKITMYVLSSIYFKVRAHREPPKSA